MLKILSTIPFRDFCEKKGTFYLEREATLANYLQQPIQGDQAKVEQFLSPPVAYGNLKDVKIFSPYGLLFDENYFVYAGIHRSHYKEALPINLKEHEPAYNFEWLESGQASFTVPSEHTVIHEDCIFVGGDTNFGHLFYEYLSRAYSVRQLSAMPIIVYDHLPKRFYDFILRVFPTNPQRLISKDKVYHCKSLFMPHAAMYRGHYSDKRTCFSPEAIYHLRSRLCTPESRRKAPAKLFIHRINAAHRRLANRDQVLSQILAKGFTLFDPSEFSMFDQIAQVSSAESIIIESGAASFLTAFAPVGCKIVELNLGGSAGHFGSFAPAIVLQQPFLRIDGKPIQAGSTPFMELDYTIDPREIEKILYFL